MGAAAGTGLLIAACTRGLILLPQPAFLPWSPLLRASHACCLSASTPRLPVLFLPQACPLITLLQGPSPSHGGTGGQCGGPALLQGPSSIVGVQGARTGSRSPAVSISQSWTDFMLTVLLMVWFSCQGTISEGRERMASTLFDGTELKRVNEVWFCARTPC